MPTKSTRPQDPALQHPRYGQLSPVAQRALQAALHDYHQLIAGKPNPRNHASMESRGHDSRS